MSKMRHFKLVTVAALASMALGACQGSKDKFKYHYKVNNCDTGAKTFDDRGSYCEALKNNQLNNFCAENLRLEAYNNQCSAPTPAGKESDAKSYSYQYDDQEKSCNTGKKTFTDHAKYCETLKNDQENNYCALEERVKVYDQECNSIETEQNKGNLDQTKKSDELAKETPEKKADDSTEADEKDTVIVSTHPESALAVTTKELDGKIISAIESKLIVDSVKPKIAEAIQLDKAAKVYFRNGLTESCKLETMKFDAAVSGQPLAVEVRI